MDPNCNSRSIYVHVECFVSKQFGTEFVSDVIQE